MIALLGAAGHVGSKVADELLREGADVRLLEHGRSLAEAAARGADVVGGDAARVDDLRALFEGAEAALVLLPEDLSDPRFVETRRTITAALARALRETGVPHVVALSAVGAERPDAAGPPAGLREYEEALGTLADASVLVLRSSMYMDYLLLNLPLIRAQGVNGSAIEPDRRIPFVATKDVAHEAAQRLLRRDFAGHRAKMLLGPEDLSMREATRLLGARLGLPELPYVQLPPVALQGGLVEGGMSEQVAALIVEMQLAINDGRPFDAVERTSAQTAPTRLEDFLAEALVGAPAH